MTDYHHLSDPELISLVRAGNRDVEEILISRYQRLVRVCARPLFLAGGDSEDLIQEGMMGLVAAIREFDVSAGTPFKAYAELCISRRLLTAVKSASRLKHQPLNSGIPLDDFLSEEAMPLAAGFPESGQRTTEEQILDKERVQELLTVFSRQLSDFEQQVFDLYLRGFSYKEIAAKLETTVKSVDNAVQRIRRKLARHLNPGDFSES